MSSRNAWCCFLLAACGTWNAGNIGPLTDPLVAEFDITLTTIGLVSGTAFFGGIVIATLAGAKIARRVPLRDGLIASCVLHLVGNLICAAAPVLAVLIAGRVIVGVGLGVTLLFGGAFARAEGGLRGLGIYGAGITLGVAMALGFGGVLEEAGLDWRLAFVLAGLIGLIPLPLIPKDAPRVAPRNEPDEGPFGMAARSLPFWRLQLLGITSLGTPLVLGVWLISWLGVKEGISVGTAGAMAFGLFGLSAVTRYYGGVLSGRGVSPTAIALFGCLVGGLGIAVIASGDGTAAAVAGVLLVGLAISVPASLVYDEGENVLPGRPLGGLSLIVTGASVFPIVAIPLIGSAIGSGDGEAALLALAVFSVLSGIANIKPAAPEPA